MIAMNTSLRFGILGTGNIAGQFARGCAAATRCTLAAVGSRSTESAATFAANHSIEKSHSSYESLLADDSVDAIYNSLPNSLHHEWTIKALRAGKHVLCEKPLATDAAEAEEMFDIAAKLGRQLVEAFMYVSHPQTQIIRDRVTRGDIGQLKLIRTNFCYRTKRIDDNIRFNPKLAGGALMDVGCYCIHFSRMLAGAEPTAIHAVAGFHPGGVDESTSGVLKFPNGVVATFSCGMATQCDNTAHVAGSDGYLEIPWPWKPQATGAMHTLAHSVPPRQDLTTGATAPPRQTFTVDAPSDMYALEADDFAATVLDGAPPRITRPDTLGNLRVLDEIRKQIGLTFKPTN